MPINEKHDQRMIGMLEEFRMNKKRSGRTKQRCISQSLHKAKLIVNLVFEPIHPRVCIFGKLSFFFRRDGHHCRGFGGSQVRVRTHTQRFCFLVKDFLPWRRRNEQRNLNSLLGKSPVGNAETSDRRDDGIEIFEVASHCDMFAGSGPTRHQTWVLRFCLEQFNHSTSSSVRLYKRKEQRKLHGTFPNRRTCRWHRCRMST